VVPLRGTLSARGPSQIFRETRERSSFLRRHVDLLLLLPRFLLRFHRLEFRFGERDGFGVDEALQLRDGLFVLRLLGGELASSLGSQSARARARA
jgi:hypothetical protein